MIRRLLVSYLTVTALVLVVLEVPLALSFRERQRDRYLLAGERDATVLASFYEEELEGRAPLDPSTAAEYSERTGARVVVVDRAGTSVIDSGDAPGRDFSTREELSEALAGRRASGLRHSETLDGDLMYVAVPVASGGEVHGALRLTFDARALGERFQRFLVGLIAIALVVLAVMGAIGWAIARSVTRPVRALQHNALRFAEGDLSVLPPPANAPPEIRDLGASLATMAVRLDELLRRQRAFVGDVSHQLRTPLTALRLRLENLESHLAGESDRAELAAAVDETVRLSELVEDLLSMARLDQEPQLGTEDLDRLAAERVDTWTALAEDAGIEVAARLAGRPVEVTVVRGGVEQILDNLVDNALKVAPVGSTVVVAVHAGARHADLTVADRGPGLDDDQKSRAVQRFWRGDANVGGTGLGLAIVDALARAAGGALSLEDNPDGGLVVRVRFRLATAAADEPRGDRGRSDRGQGGSSTPGRRSVVLGTSKTARRHDSAAG